MRLDQYKRALEHDDCRLIIITGPPRRGKSTLSLRIARYVTPAFTVDDVTFDGTGFKRRLAETSPGGTVTLDEAILGGNSRRAMTADNVDMMNSLTIWGSRNCLGIVCYPKWSRLDGAIRDHAHARIHIPRKGLAYWYDVYHPDFAREPVLRGRVKFTFNKLPDGPFRRAYELKSQAWKRDQLKPEAKKPGPPGLKAQAIIAAIRSNPKVRSTDLARQFGVSQPYISKVRNQFT